MSDGIKYEVSESITAGISPEHGVSLNHDYDEFIRDFETLKQTQQSHHEVLMELTENLQSMSSIYEEKYAEVFTAVYDLTNTQNDTIKIIDRIISNIESESSSTRKEFNSLWKAFKIEALVIGVLLGGWIIHVL